MVELEKAAGTPLRSNEGLCFRLVASADGDDLTGKVANSRASAELPEPIKAPGRYIVTCDRNRHQFFWFASRQSDTDSALVYIASSDPFHLGVLSSIIHITWLRTVGATAEDHPIYDASRCFAAFPFPEPSLDVRKQISDLAERLDQHRKTAMAADDRVAMTAIYDVVTKLRSTEVFTPEERIVHQVAEGRVLREMHHDLDYLVARAYGWRWPMNKQGILGRLVELHDERVEEEKAGRVRWLCPEYQIPRFGAAANATPTPGARADG